MPELPDVELQKQSFDTHALSKKVSRVRVNSKKVLDGISAVMLKRRIENRRFVLSKRRGKWLYAELDSGGLVLFHFGMTGELVFLRSSDEPPEFARVVFDFSGGSRMVYVCVRQFGRVGFFESEEQFLQEKQLGPDAYGVDERTFGEVLRGRKASLKAVLMDQAALAGIGNIYADEILFKARISPHRKADELSNEELHTLLRAVKQVFDMAIKKRADARRLPKSYLIHNRFEGGRCPRCDGELKSYKGAGRRGWFCPSCQR